MIVTISQEAFRIMILYATTHSKKQVHGILVGSTSDDGFVVENAFPVCHETPTRPLLDMAEALVEAKLANDNLSKYMIVGWFTSPEILSERVSDPVAMRVASVLPKSADGILLVLQNEEIGRLASDDEVTAAACIHGFGKDFGKQWTNVLEVSILDEPTCVEATRKEILYGRKIDDLIDHWQNGGSSPWHPIVT